MIWNKNLAKQELLPADLQIMRQCNMSLGEIPMTPDTNSTIPPLWSILSYAMLGFGSSAESIWSHYRLLKRLAAQPERYYYERRIPKANGDMRTLCVPGYDIRFEQHRIMEYILSGLPVDEHACAYRKGVSLEACARPHINQGVLIHLDIQNFFGSIKENMVYSTLLRQTGYAKSLCRLFARLCCYCGSLPQGAVTSPMLSNIVFRPCDEALTEIAGKHQLVYTRYSDDLFFSGSDDTDVSAVLRAVTDCLKHYGFRLNSEKTKVRRPQHRQAVLGYTVNERLQVNRTYRRQLLQELYYLERFGKNCKGAIEAGDYLKYMQQLMGRLAYALHADPRNRDLREAHLKLSIRMSCYS